jgi:hypothetical protein
MKYFDECLTKQLGAASDSLSFDGASMPLLIAYVFGSIVIYAI